VLRREEIMNRTRSSIKNMAVTLVGALVTMLLQLVNRRIFVNYLASDYLGLNGLFSNVLSMLSLSELGVGSAMIFALYRPVAEKDNEKIKSLMLLYKRMYTVIGCFILGVGFAITPFLSIFIKEMPDIPYIHVYYIMYVLDIGLSYFYTYKRSLIICNREDYISSTTTMCSVVGTRFIQLLVLVFTHNYFLFLLAQVLINRLENIVISKIADKKYPYLLEKNVKPLEKDATDGIKKNIVAMMAHKVGDVIVNGTDNIIISKILGLSVLGIYSNYYLLISAIQGMISKVFHSLISNVGNLVVEKEKEETERVFYNIFFANYWIFGICSVCFFCLLQPFVRLWLGDDFLLSDITIWILVLVFYINGMRSTALIFRNASGIFRHDRYKALVEAAINIIASIPLTISFGVAGVKLGTLISTITTSFWIEGYVLYKFYFNKSMRKYMMRQLVYLLFVLCVCFIVNQLCVIVDDNDVVSFALECIICIAIPNLLFVLAFWRTQEFKYFLHMAKRIFRKGRM